MAFDDESKFETFPEFPDDAIEKYLLQWLAGLDRVYKGLSRSDLRSGGSK